MAGHLLNITITANEALKTANVTVFGITSMMMVNGTTASANVTVDENSCRRSWYHSTLQPLILQETA